MTWGLLETQHLRPTLALLNPDLHLIRSAVISGFPSDSVVKNLSANIGDTGSIWGLGRSLGEGNGNPLQYSCLGNPMDRGTWWATVHGVTETDKTEHTPYIIL